MKRFLQASCGSSRQESVRRRISISYSALRSTILFCAVMISRVRRGDCCAAFRIDGNTVSGRKSPLISPLLRNLESQFYRYPVHGHFRHLPCPTRRLHRKALRPKAKIRGPLLSPTPLFNSARRPATADGRARHSKLPSSTSSIKPFFGVLQFIMPRNRASAISYQAFAIDHLVLRGYVLRVRSSDRVTAFRVDGNTA